MSNPKQLNLLADHIKLSLLERQRAISLNIEQTTQDGHISRSLDDLKVGLNGLVKERDRLEDAGDITASSALQENYQRLESQYNDLHSQFHGHPPSNSHTLTSPNDPSLANDFIRASTTRPAGPNSTSSFTKKSVRFTDSPTISISRPSSEDPNRANLFYSTYHDEPDPLTSNVGDLDNQQLHAYHSQVIRDQDEQLDRLGESIGRQRELSIQIGDELDGHVQLLDEIDGRMERHGTRLDQARRGLGNVARKAGDNKEVTVIVVLIILLVLLIIILK